MTQVGRTRPPHAHAARAALPPQAVAALRRAFAAELAQRLPRLAAAVGADSPEQLAGALRDAHTLGSSGDIVGAGDAAATARAIEDLLRLAAGDPAAPGLVGLAALVDQLHAQLRGWRR